MTEVKTFKIEQKFEGVEELYKYLRKNVKLLEQVTNLQIQKPLKVRPFCISAKEKITERQIVIFASERDFPESLGELIVFAGAYDAYIVIFLLQKNSKNYLMPMNWLAKTCAEDYQFIMGQVEF
jgi:hypothetical protein